MRKHAAEPRRGRRRRVRRGGGRRLADGPRARGGDPGGGLRHGRRVRIRLGLGDLGERRGADAGEAVRDAGGPRPCGRRLGEQAAGRLGVARRLLAQQVVRERAGDLAAAARRRARAPRGRPGRGPHRVGGDAEQRRDLVVGAPLLQHERDDGALVRGEGLERAHRPPLKCARREGHAKPCPGATCRGSTASTAWRSSRCPTGGHRPGRGARRAPPARRTRARRRLRLDRRVDHLDSPPGWRSRAGGQSAQGLSNQTSFLRPILDGTIHAVARRRHRGRTTWVWEVEITDDEGRLCALVRMTIAVRAARLGLWSRRDRWHWPWREGQSALA